MRRFACLAVVVTLSCLASAEAGEPVVKDGLAVSAEATGGPFAEGQAINFRVSYANRTEKPLMLLNWNQPEGWTVRVQAADGKAAWEVVWPVAAQTATPAPPAKQLDAGSATLVNMLLGPAHRYRRAAGGPVADSLPVGSYRLVITVKLPDRPAAGSQVRLHSDLPGGGARMGPHTVVEGDPFWTGEVTVTSDVFAVAPRGQASKPAVRGGLSVAVRATQETFAPEQALAFDILLNNVGKEELALGGANLPANWVKKATITDVKSGAAWQPRMDWKLRQRLFPGQPGPGPIRMMGPDRPMAPMPGGPVGAPVRYILLNLKPGETYTAHLNYTPQAAFFVQGDPDKPDKAVEHLPPGRYRIVLEIDFTGSAPANEAPAHWGKLTTEPAEFAIAAPPAEAGADAGPRVMIKVVAGQDRQPAGVPGSEAWVIEQTAKLGSPHASDNTAWKRLTDEDQVLYRSSMGGRLIRAQLQGDLEKGAMVVVSGIKIGRSPRQVQLAGTVGERHVIRLTDYPPPANVFVAVEVVAGGADAKSDLNWGKPAGGVRVALQIAPDRIAPAGKVTVTLHAENVSKDPVQILDWRAQWIQLELLDADGKVISRGGGANRSRLIREDDNVTLEAGQRHSWSTQLRLEKGKLIADVLTGGILHWPNEGNQSLAPGDYMVLGKLVVRSADTDPNDAPLAVSAPTALQIAAE